MKLVILAGGFGTRISEESVLKPKPLIEIGAKPIIWHIMKYYSCFGIKEFIICCGYKGHMLKEYFINFSKNNSDIEINTKNNELKFINKKFEDWKITLVDTGENTMTGGRILKVKKYLKNEKVFCLTYGDGLSNINVSKLIKFHKKNKRIATLTAVKQPGRFGHVDLEGSMVSSFREKIKKDNNWINGGFFVLNKEIFNYIKNSKTIFEKYSLQKVSKKKQLCAYKHDGFWYAMDSIREKNFLEDLWKCNKAPWKKWK